MAKIGSFGEEYVKQYLLDSLGFSEVRFRHKGEVGFDFVGVKDGSPQTIEVKTTMSMHGIPDMHSNEFTKAGEKFMFVPDLLIILRVDGQMVPQALEVITKEEIDKYADNHIEVHRIRTRRLDTDLKNGVVGTRISLK